MPDPAARADTFPHPEVDSRGVDLSQVRRMLALTPAQRLDQLEAAQASLMELRNAFDRKAEEHPGKAR